MLTDFEIRNGKISCRSDMAEKGDYTEPPTTAWHVLGALPLKNPLQPNMSKNNLPIVLTTFLKFLTGRIWFAIKTS